MNLTHRSLAITAAVVTLLASGALANDLPPIPALKTKQGVKFVPIAPPLQAVDGSATFFGQTLPTQTPPTCVYKSRVSGKFLAAAGDITTTIKITDDKTNPNVSPIVNQFITWQARLHDDGCTTSWVLPALTFSGNAQGAPTYVLASHKGAFTVLASTIINANGGLFPTPRLLCPGDIINIRHQIQVGGCWHEADFTVLVP